MVPRTGCGHSPSDAGDRQRSRCDDVAARWLGQRRSFHASTSSKEIMRHLLVVIAFGLTHLVGAGGCAAFHHLDEYTTSDSAKPGGEASVHDDDAVVVVTPESSTPTDVAGCKRNLDCNQTATRSINGEPSGPSV